MSELNDLAIPEIKLIQNVGGDDAKQMGAKAGDFYCSITQEIIPGSEGFDVVVLRPAQKTRTYWGREDIDDEPPVCASEDGVTSINGDICAEACPYGAFTDAPYMVSAAERRAKCLPNYNIVVIKVSDMMPVMIRCSGISSMAARELNTLLKFHKMIKNAPHKATIKVTSIKKKTASGEAYAIKFGDPKLVTDEDLLYEIADQASALLGETIEVQALPEPPAPAALPEPKNEEPKEQPKLSF